MGLTYNQESKDEIETLLVGHRVVKVSDDVLELDDGRRLKFVGNDGCVCGSGCYDLTELNGVDNIITNVEFVDVPGGDYYDTSGGRYEIFVFADNRKVNLATFGGTNGNGYYGTGYKIHVASQ